MRTTTIALLFLAAGCAHAPGQLDGGDAGAGADAMSTVDAGVDAELDGGGDLGADGPFADAGVDAGSIDSAVDAPSCDVACTLYIPGMLSCPDGQACYAHECSTSCDAFVGSVTYGAACTNTVQCTPHHQCLTYSGGGTCFGFCRIGHNEDCPAHGSMECIPAVGMHTIDRGEPDDGETVMLPSGFGVCS